MVFVDFRLSLRHNWRRGPLVHTTTAPIGTKSFVMHVNLYYSSNRERTKNGLYAVLLLMLRYSSDPNLEVRLFLRFMVRRIRDEIL